MTSDNAPSEHTTSQRLQPYAYALLMQEGAEDHTRAIEVHHGAQQNYASNPSARNLEVLTVAEKTLTRVAVRYAGLQALALDPSAHDLKFFFEPDGTPVVLSKSILEHSSVAAIVEHLEMCSIAALNALADGGESGLTAGSTPGSFSIDLNHIQTISRRFQA